MTVVIVIVKVVAAMFLSATGMIMGIMIRIMILVLMMIIIVLIVIMMITLVYIALKYQRIPIMMPVTMIQHH